MINSANQYPISEIFGIDTKLKYVIPKFQREYIWGRDDWEYLFNDLIDNERGYFLGSIICINRGVDSLEITPMEIIDGQQRLTTISLLYAAIYDRFLIESRADDDFISEKINLKHRLIQKSMKDRLKIELSYQNKNNPDYHSILNEMGLYDKAGFKKPSHLGNRRIYKTYQYFRKRIKDYEYEVLIDLLEKVNTALIVKIEVDNHADAFILFESLNNRGIPLSAMDLVKNKLLAELEKKDIMDIDEAYGRWLGLIENLPKYSHQERFLRQYYNAYRYKEEVKIKGISKATKSNLIKIYENLIERDISFIFNELIKKSELYHNFIEPSDTGDMAVFYNGLLDLLHVGSAPSYTLLLYLFSEHPKQKAMIKNVIEFLVKYFVRRNLTDFPGTRDLDTFFIGLIKECEDNMGSLSSDFIISYLTQPDKFSSLDLFGEKLEGNIYDENQPLARFILCKLEEVHMTREIHRDFWERDKNRKYIWTIEHIFPKGKNIPSDWVDMIALGDMDLAKEIQEEWVHKLGNLTLTGYNQNLSNFSFIKKRDRTDNKSRSIGYKNGLYLNKTLEHRSQWTEDDIVNRSKELVGKALELFSLRSELT